MVDSKQAKSFNTHKYFELMPTDNLIVVKKQKLQVLKRVKLLLCW